MVELIGGASHINVLDNRLLSWDDPPINNPPTHAHIQHRNQGNGLPKKVNAARNIYLGVGLENNL